MSRPSQLARVPVHPDWCVLDRCGQLVPPVLAHLERRHRGVLLKVGAVRPSGAVVSYLIGADGQTPSVRVHASCRAGTAWAELSLPQAGQLVEQLRSLLAQADGQEASVQNADGEEGGEHGGS
ncbi:hypothetical protein QQG74_28185 [Micromonospora sp. FIMYZ51]|uniref:hypothetical protein n=1 Tax=Micromonospora sp. FIMYZ51 TaxID=3051832 RepID=UPI00311D476B